MRHLALTVATALLVALPLGVSAQVEETATEEEAQQVRDAIARINCEAEAIEKESDDLLAIDDAACEIGQYDIKLNCEYVIMSMTYDGPVDN